MTRFNLDQFVRHLHGEKIPYEETEGYKRYFPLSKWIITEPEWINWLNGLKRHRPDFFKYGDDLFGIELYYSAYPITEFYEKQLLKAA
jgi:hypothetical protein